MQTFSIHRSELDNVEIRLNADYYAEAIVMANLVLRELELSGISIKTVGEITERVFWPGRFKRKYTNKNEGVPFLMPTEVLSFFPIESKYIKDPPADTKIENWWVLITRSGTVGRSCISSNYLRRFALSDDLIRVLPKSIEMSCYLYAFLNTWVGRTLISVNKYGSAIKHIEPNHVNSIRVPILEDVFDEVVKKIRRSSELLEMARNKIIEAYDLFYKELGIEPIEEDQLYYLPSPEDRKIKIFTVRASELNYRLDASYHLPVLRLISERIHKSKLSTKYIGDVIDDIFVPERFKRNYVNSPDIGIPFLQGSHIPQIRPLDLKYIWKGTKNIDEMKLKKNWLLMTRSGTVGRLGIVRENWDGWAASEHIYRLIPKNNDDAGYLLTFLSSEYGQKQIEGKIYGAVVEEIGESDTDLVNEIELMWPEETHRIRIGNVMLSAYDLRDAANKLEEEAIRLLERKLDEAIKKNDQ